MDVVSKQFVINTPENLTVEYIEDLIVKSGYMPLRWAIVKSDESIFIIESIVIKD